jgi:hypothetical protein
MKRHFHNMMQEVERKYDMLIASTPFAFSEPPVEISEKRGVYLASEHGTPLYVGRANDLRKRLQNHLHRSHNTATFAFLLARHDTGILKATYQTIGSRDDLLKNNEAFSQAFDLARKRIGQMDVQVVEEDNPTKQALLEIYAATVSGAKYNSFDNH